MMTLVLLQNRLEHRVVLLTCHINVEKVTIYYVSNVQYGLYNSLRFASIIQGGSNVQDLLLSCNLRRIRVGVITIIYDKNTFHS